MSVVPVIYDDISWGIVRPSPGACADLAGRNELLPIASGQAFSYHSGAGRERQEGSGPAFSPNQSLLAAFWRCRAHRPRGPPQGTAR